MCWQAVNLGTSDEYGHVVSSIDENSIRDNCEVV